MTLDPRLSTTQVELQQRFDLLMQIHDAVNALDEALTSGSSEVPSILTSITALAAKSPFADLQDAAAFAEMFKSRAGVIDV